MLVARYVNENDTAVHDFLSRLQCFAVTPHLRIRDCELRKNREIEVRIHKYRFLKIYPESGSVMFLARMCAQDTLARMCAQGTCARNECCAHMRARSVLCVCAKKHFLSACARKKCFLCMRITHSLSIRIQPTTNESTKLAF